MSVDKHTVNRQNPLDCIHGACSSWHHGGVTNTFFFLEFSVNLKKQQDGFCPCIVSLFTEGGLSNMKRANSLNAPNVS